MLLLLDWVGPRGWAVAAVGGASVRDEKLRAQMWSSACKQLYLFNKSGKDPTRHSSNIGKGGGGCSEARHGSIWIRHNLAKTNEAFMRLQLAF